MKNKILFTIALIIMLTPGVALAWPWSWDMYTQPSNRAQKYGAPPMPKDSVPTTGKQLPMETRADSFNIPNPEFPTDESLARGKHIYDTYCEICHGGKGLGDGLVGKKYMTPADLTSDYVQKQPDGSLYFVITYGGILKDDHMPAYGDAISPQDRWHLINYIKQVLTFYSK